MPHNTRIFQRLTFHIRRRFSRPFAGTVGTFLKNAKIVFPIRAVETAGIAIFIISGTAGLIAVKARFLLHKQFKRPFFILGEKHSDCASFLSGMKKRRRFFNLRRGNTYKGTLFFYNAPFAFYSFLVFPHPISITTETVM